jgi:transposase
MEMANRKQLNLQIEELLRVNAALVQVVEEQAREIDALKKTVKELTERLDMNSKNSSKPPSADGLGKPAPKSLRGKSGKKTGGQVGHPGANLVLPKEPDRYEQHMPQTCVGCPRFSTCLHDAGVKETRHVIDAKISLEVTAHQSMVITCPKTAIQLKGGFPHGVDGHIQYGDSIRALAVMLNTFGAVSVERTGAIMSGVLGISLSEGTICNIISRCAKDLAVAVDVIRGRVTSSELGNFDETGTRVNGKTMWVHNASTPEYTHLTIHRKRGHEGMDAGGVLPGFLGTLVHDCLASYWKYGSSHALCCAHILRELIAAAERDPGQKWAKYFKELLLEMKSAKEHEIENGATALAEEVVGHYMKLYDDLITLGYLENPQPEPPADEVKKPGRVKRGKTLSLIDRLEKHKASVCRFLTDFFVPFDNNQAERDIRMVKTKTKVSGCFRSEDGARDYFTIMSYIGTAKKLNFNPFDAIKQAISGNPLFIFSCGGE